MSDRQLSFPAGEETLTNSPNPENLPQPAGTVAELFAGVGGFRLGLESANLKVIFSNQWEPSTKVQHASDVYVARFGSEGHTNVDIADLADIPEVDVLVGGFPCQDYSVAKSLNSSKGLEGKKGVLWWEILRLIAQRKPQFVFLENVDRLLKSPSSQRGRDFAVMLKSLGDEGYSIEWRVANSADYGYPQRRLRVFIVAYRSQPHSLSPRDVIFSSGVLAKALSVQKDSAECEVIALDDSLQVISDNFNVGATKSPFLNAGWYSDGFAHTIQVSSNYKGEFRTLADVLVPDELVPKNFWIEQGALEDWVYLKGPKSIERTHKSSGAVYRYAEGGMAFPDPITRPSRTILTGEGGTSPSRFKHVISTKNGFRRLTPLELERLNGFPDNWTEFGSNSNATTDARRAFFMGNALVIGLVEQIGHEIASRLRASRLA